MVNHIQSIIQYCTLCVGVCQCLSTSSCGTTSSRCVCWRWTDTSSTPKHSPCSRPKTPSKVCVCVISTSQQYFQFHIQFLSPTEIDPHVVGGKALRCRVDIGNLACPCRQIFRKIDHVELVMEAAGERYHSDWLFCLSKSVKEKRSVFQKRDNVKKLYLPAVLCLQISLLE